MKMPLPTMPPMTSMVASKRPSRLARVGNGVTPVLMGGDPVFDHEIVVLWGDVVVVEHESGSDGGDCGFDL